MTLSIVTINYNNSEGLQNTIESVISQTYKPFEFIVIDGGSNDGSVEVIKKYKDKITFWQSEPDKGVYNAMNKGIKQSSGEYLLMLNSGDYLSDTDILQKMMVNCLGEDIIYGDVIWNNENTFYYGYIPSVLTFRYFINSSLGHQATIIKRTAHDIVGLYDETYKIVSDWNFFLIGLFKYGLTYKYVPIKVSICSRDGMSCKPENSHLIIKERTEILNKSFSLFMPDYMLLDAVSNELKTIKKQLLYRVFLKLNNVLNRKK